MRGVLAILAASVLSTGNALNVISTQAPIFGARIGLNFAERLNLRAEYEVVEIDGLDDPNAVWLTAAWRF